MLFRSGPTLVGTGTCSGPGRRQLRLLRQRPGRSIWYLYCPLPPGTFPIIFGAYCRFYKILVILSTKMEHLFYFPTLFSTNLSRLRREPVAPMRCVSASPHPLLWAFSVFCFCPFCWTDLHFRCVPLAVWWGLLSMDGPLNQGPPLLCSGPEPGASQGQPGSILSPCARRRGPGCKGPPMRAAILQHRLYTASAIAVDVPPGRWLRSGSRGDSLRGLVHTSPIRPRAVARWGLGSHTPQYMYTGPPPIGSPASWAKNNSCSGGAEQLAEGGSPFKRVRQHPG